MKTKLHVLGRLVPKRGTDGKQWWVLASIGYYSESMYAITHHGQERFVEVWSPVEADSFEEAKGFYEAHVRPLLEKVYVGVEFV